jgi:hypothetical protein
VLGHREFETHLKGLDDYDVVEEAEEEASAI